LPSTTGTPSPEQAEKAKQKALENAEKESLEKKVKREYYDELEGIVCLCA